MKAKSVLREEAAARQELRNKRTDQEQLDRLSAAGHFNTKEVKRLKAKIQAEKEHQAQIAIVKESKKRKKKHVEPE